MTRKKIPTSIETEVMFMSDLKCCIDNKKGDHIHHIDGNNSNNEMDNLVLLCFDCHNLASIKNSLSKKLSPRNIKKYREHHYSVIRTHRENSLEKISGKVIKSLTQENIIDATTTSIILIEISKIQDEYYKNIKMDRNEILEKILIYKGQSNPRILISVLNFLNRVVYETRSGLPSNMIITVKNITTSYFSNLSTRCNNQQLLELGKSATNLARTIIYDTSIHSHNFKSMSIGYSIIEFIYHLAQSNRIKNLEEHVLETFEKLKSQLNRPERNDLEIAKKMRLIHLENLNQPKQSNTNYSKEILGLIENQK